MGSNDSASSSSSPSDSDDSNYGDATSHSDSVDSNDSDKSIGADKKKRKGKLARRIETKNPTSPKDGEVVMRARLGKGEAVTRAWPEKGEAVTRAWPEKGETVTRAWPEKETMTTGCENKETWGRVFRCRLNDGCQFRCELCCKEFLYDIRINHLDANHSLTEEQYVDQFGPIGFSKTVYHRCLLCRAVLRLTRADMTGHLEAHQLSLRAYQELYMSDGPSLQGSGGPVPSKKQHSDEGAKDRIVRRKQQHRKHRIASTSDSDSSWNERRRKIKKRKSRILSSSEEDGDIPKSARAATSILKEEIRETAAKEGQGNHKAWYDGNSYSCRQCDWSVGALREMQAHLWEAHGCRSSQPYNIRKTENTYTCQICSEQVYWDKKAIQEHLDSRHFMDLEGYARLYVLPMARARQTTPTSTQEKTSTSDSNNLSRSPAPEKQTSSSPPRSYAVSAAVRPREKKHHRTDGERIGEALLKVSRIVDQPKVQRQQSTRDDASQSDEESEPSSLLDSQRLVRSKEQPLRAERQRDRSEAQHKGTQPKYVDSLSKCLFERTMQRLSVEEKRVIDERTWHRPSVERMPSGREATSTPPMVVGPAANGSAEEKSRTGDLFACPLGDNCTAVFTLEELRSGAAARHGIAAHQILPWQIRRQGVRFQLLVN